MVLKGKYLLILFSILSFSLGAQMTVDQIQRLTMEEMLLFCEDTSHHSEEIISFVYEKAKESQEDLNIARIELVQSRLAYLEKDYSSSLKQALSAKQRIEAESENDILPRAYMRIAVALEEIGAIDEAIKYRKLQRDFLENKGFDRKSAYLNNFIGNLYVKINQPDSARYFYKLNLASSLEFGDDKRSAFCRNNIGLTFLQSGRIDSSIVEFYKSLEYYNKDSSKRGVSMLSTIYGNLTYAYMKKKDYAKALALNELSYNVAEDRGLSYFSTRALNLKGRVLSEKGSYMRSNEILDRVIATENYEEFFTKDEKLQILDIKTHNFTSLGNYKKALELSKDHIRLYEKFYGKEKLDELYHMRSNFQSLDIKNELKLEQVISEKRGEQIKSLRQAAEISTFRILVISLLALILIGVGAFFLYRLKRKNEIERLSNELLKETNKRQSQRLTETTLNLARKKEFAQDLKEKISELESLDSSEKVSIKMFVDNELQIDDSLLEMDKLVNQLGDEFFVKLKNRYPKLTENDLKLCGLIRLKLTTKQISIVKSITPQSVKVTKHRLRKKMDIEKGTLIYEFLKDI